MNISLSPGDDESFGYGLQLGFSPCERGAPDNTKNGREMPVGQQQRQLATTTTISGSRRHGAVFSVVFASVVTLVLVYSLTRASWTDFGSAGGSQAWYDDECLNSLSEGTMGAVDGRLPGVVTGRSGTLRQFDGPPQAVGVQRPRWLPAPKPGPGGRCGAVLGEEGGVRG